ncbi:MAG: (2Fe-2S)-binding protein [Burkholderiaceae bacterium]|jgi:aerobic-type carbon monoxide dehydrogenase small subunit (CoxS/CutS family)|nr:(2Fe-2S)-binding protein [Betaproteobacteria bacterium]MDA9885558.1 (2Fe-2S)-binding protein [Burkholderiaceae bacterium]MDC1458259.1 (2Fe-2S)-binding protein [Burkholderiaceae bacterium]MDG1107250.1 (2Fe-2S)-binding protein [Burkholderiaceae bacterium]MDO7554071.1 (2Fe-2S)-binding protein [Burkholderiaceae bacterium]
MSEKRCDISVMVNAERVERPVLVRQHLVDFLREELDLTGSHLGCEHGVCGACQVMVDGQVVRGCLTLAVQTDGKHVETIEGLSESGVLADLQEAFLNHNALQCGFCSSGMLLSALNIVRHYPDASREDIRDHISGNYCRCTGYQAIVNAIESVLLKNRSAAVVGVSS